jgi:aminocarboxymuconate-semialdehyde decarboxylase
VNTVSPGQPTACTLPATSPRTRGGRLTPPSAYLRQLYFDSLVYDAGTARRLIDVAGPGHVLVGTDYPFDMGVTDPLLRLDAVPGLSDAERAAIAGGTAARLLGVCP